MFILKFDNIKDSVADTGLKMYGCKYKNPPHNHEWKKYRLALDSTSLNFNEMRYLTYRNDTGKYVPFYQELRWDEKTQQIIRNDTGVYGINPPLPYLSFLSDKDGNIIGFCSNREITDDEYYECENFELSLKLHYR
jgi:hypothetical protein